LTTGPDAPNLCSVRTGRARREVGMRISITGGRGGGLLVAAAVALVAPLVLRAGGRPHRPPALTGV